MNELESAAKSSGLIKSGGKILGVEGLSRRHLSVASIVLVQGTSQHFIEKGILPGKIANTLTNEAMTNTEFVPAYMTEKLFVYKYLDEKCQKKEFLFVATDEHDSRLDDKRMRWEDGKKPEVIPTFIVAAIMGGKPVKISLRGTAGYPAGQKLWTLIYESAKSESSPAWGNKYKLLSVARTNKNGDKYYAFDIEKVGPASDEDIASATSLYDSFKSGIELTDAE